jgi:ribosomal-protein-alanine N-acetyltransferase
VSTGTGATTGTGASNDPPRPERVDPARLSFKVLASADRADLAEVEDMELVHFGRGGQNLWGLMPMVEHGRIVLARLDGEAVAWAIVLSSFRRDPPTAHLFSFGVARKHQNRGIGSALLAHVTALLASEGTRRLELTVAPANIAALHLYRKKFGFALERSLPDWYGEGEDRFLLTRELY